MRIEQPSATLLSITPEAELLIERAGRTCYKSEGMISEGSAAKFIEMIVKRGHFSVLEHASATILFVCDRGVSHELVRHRLASYSQESTRYCNYSKEKHGSEIAVIQPPDLGGFAFAWKKHLQSVEKMYLAMLSKGIPPQIARSILPNALKTEIVTTANLREWLHILRLRTHKTAHPQIREIMEMARERLVASCPNVFKEFVIT